MLQPPSQGFWLDKEGKGLGHWCGLVPQRPASWPTFLEHHYRSFPPILTHTGWKGELLSVMQLQVMVDVNELLGVEAAGAGSEHVSVSSPSALLPRGTLLCLGASIVLSPLLVSSSSLNVWCFTDVTMTLL